jgi:hypothetical protein
MTDQVSREMSTPDVLRKLKSKPLAVHEGGTFRTVVEAVSHLGRHRISNDVRAETLNEFDLKISSEPWSPKRVSGFASKNGIRLAPVSERMFMIFERNKADEHALLPLILDQVKKGRTSLTEIREGLAKDFEVDTYNRAPYSKERSPYVPGERVIARVLKYCSNDSPEVEQDIKDAMRQGLNVSNPTSSSIPQFLNAVRAKQKKMLTA